MAIHLSGSLPAISDDSSLTWEWQIDDAFLYIWFSSAQIFYTEFAYAWLDGRLTLLERIDGNVAICSIMSQECCEQAELAMKQYISEMVLK